MNGIEKSEQRSYYCTWLAQNFIASEAGEKRAAVRPEFTGDQGANCARDKINEHTVFGNTVSFESPLIILSPSNLPISPREWTFQENEFWYQPINGHTIRQGAPAIV